MAVIETPTRIILTEETAKSFLEKMLHPDTIVAEKRNRFLEICINDVEEIKNEDGSWTVTIKCRDWIDEIQEQIKSIKNGEVENKTWKEYKNELNHDE